MNNPRFKFDDAVGAAHSLIHAMKLMAESSFKGEGDDYCAFTLIADLITRELSDADAAFTDLENGKACK